jgi:hypothetical protein
MSEAASRSRRLVSTRVCVSVIVRSIPDLPWVPSKGYPERSVDRCTLTGDINGSGLYYTLIFTGTQAAGSKSAPLLHHHVPARTMQNRSVV